MSEIPPDGVPENAQAASGWQAVVEDAAATAEQYREDGWTTHELHPGDSVLVDSEFRTGLDVLLPGDEYEALESMIDDTSFTDVDVFRAESDGMLYLLVVEKAPDDETAVLVPAYYDPGRSQAELDAIQDADEFRLFCRRLNNEYVEFVHTDHTPFLPDVFADGQDTGQ